MQERMEVIPRFCIHPSAQDSEGNPIPKEMIENIKDEIIEIMVEDWEKHKRKNKLRCYGIVIEDSVYPELEVNGVKEERQVWMNMEHTPIMRQNGILIELVWNVEMVG